MANPGERVADVVCTDDKLTVDLGRLWRTNGASAAAVRKSLGKRGFRAAVTRKGSP